MSLLIFIICWIVSCSKQENEDLNTEITLCAFVISDNSLDDHSNYIENDFVQGLKGCPPGTELFLYIDSRANKPILRQLIILESGKVAIKETWHYEEQCSTSPEVFRNILSTMIENSSGKQYGLFYWSHGNGWLPGTEPNNGDYATKAIGMDGSVSMNVDDMAAIIADIKVPLFTVMDACYMGGVEVAYDMRYSTKYLIASAAETLGVGFPYKTMIPILAVGTRSSLISSLDSYLEFCYMDYYQDGQISGMASIVDCSQMDSLATIVRTIVTANNKCLDLDGIQTYDGSFNHVYYDFGQYVTSMIDEKELLDIFINQLNRTVIYKVNTPFVYNSSYLPDHMIEVKNYSGLNTYIPNSNIYSDWLYSQIAWYKYCYEKQN